MSLNSVVPWRCIGVIKCALCTFQQLMSFAFPVKSRLTHWGWVTHICVGNLTIIGPDNGLSPVPRQAIIWTNAWILLIGPWGTNFCEILIGIQAFSFKKMHLKRSSAKWHPFCLGLNVLMLSDSKHYLNEEKNTGRKLLSASTCCQSMP